MATVSSSKFFGGSPGTVVQPAAPEALPTIPSKEERKGIFETLKTTFKPLVEKTAQQATGIRDKAKQAISEGAEDVTSLIGTQSKKYGEEDSLLGKTAILGQSLGRAAMETAKTAGKLFAAPIAQGMETAIDAISETSTAQSIAQNPLVSRSLDSINQFIGSGIENYDEWKANNPELAKDAEGVAEIVLLATGEKATTEAIRRFMQATKAVERGAVGVMEGIGGATTKAIDSTVEGFKGAVTAPFEGVSNVVGKTKNYLSRKNVPENFDATIQRVEDPLAKYDEFYAQEQKFKGDIKQDTALSLVGDRIGSSFDKVIKQRQAVGQKMADEVKKIGDIETDVSQTFPKFEQELFDNGLTYDASKGIQASKQSKVSSQDIEMLNQYVAELNRLGTNPTVAELDAFLSRVPKEIDVYKNTKNITSTTNGERMVKANLRELRSSLSPKANPAFKDYFQAREDYSTLSDFLDDGISFLGKKTQSGDYAKDASLAKSSVQSVLNQGKKDWLLKLEDLTGYKALDESVLALQAMKDAGNFRGRSLLDLLTEDKNIPLSTSGLIQKGVEKAIDIGASKVVGSPAEQTRRVIRERLNQRENLPISPKTNINSTRAPKMDSNSSITNTIPQTKVNARDVAQVLNDADQTTLLKFADLRAGAKPGRIPKELRQEVIGILQENLNIRIPENATDDVIAQMIRDMFDSSFANQITI